MDDKNANMAARYEREIPEGYEARIEGNKVIIELKESEDERIRKMLIEQMERWKKAAEDNNVEQDVKDASAAIAYLEKQKEQKPESCDCSRDEESYTNGIHHVLMNPEAYGLIKQKPAKWSEEDERTLESFLGWLQGSMGEKTYSSWLKSLPERFSLKPKQEWSEEDERKRQACISTINEVIDYERERWEDYNPGKPYRPIMKYDEQIDWLKSLRPQPHWKPSASQKKRPKEMAGNVFTC